MFSSAIMREYIFKMLHNRPLSCALAILAYFCFIVSMALGIL